jgi:probable HAF family extracellular repeat protein
MKVRKAPLCILAAGISLMAVAAQAQTPTSCTIHTFKIPTTTGVAIASGMNSGGTIVGTVNLPTSGRSDGFVRFAADGRTRLLNVPNSTATSISHRNDVGVQVGAFTPTGSNNQRGFVNSGTKFQSVTFPGAQSTFLKGINRFGTIVGDYLGTDGHFHGFRLKNGQFSSIHPNGATDTFVNGINDNGIIVGNFFTGGVDSNGFVRSSTGGITTLNFPGEVGFGGTTLNDISNSGQIVGTVWTSSDTRASFVHKNGKFETFSVPHSRLTDVFGINNLNQMVGHTIVLGTNTETDEAFTATCK